MHDILILIPAAGAASRMRGGDKLLEPVDGLPLLVRQIGVGLASGAHVLVTLPPDRPPREAAVAGLDDDRLICTVLPGAAEGMAASIRAGAKAAMERGADGMMILLPDMPEIDANDVQVLLDAFDRRTVVRAMGADGTPGHPVIIPARFFKSLQMVTGDLGARSVLRGQDITAVPLPGQRATTDLDTPEDWATWRAQNAR